MRHNAAILPFLCGGVAFLVAFVPGLLEGFADAIANAPNLWLSNYFVDSRKPIGNQRYWFVDVGLAFFAIGLLNYFSN